MSDDLNPKAVLAAGLILAGVIWGVYLAGIPTTANLTTSVVVGDTTHTCPNGYILSGLKCYPIQRGNIDIDVNYNDTFQLPSDERGTLDVVSGKISVNDASSVTYYTQGQRATVPYKALVTVLQNGTKLHFTRVFL